MFELIFGTIISTTIYLFIKVFYKPIDPNLTFSTTKINEFGKWPFIIMIIIFVVGIILIIKGIIKIIINISTSTKGEICFGIIKKIYPSGAKINEKDELIADILIYIESKKESRIIKETIGFNQKKYEIGSLLKLKYYKNDINILSKVNNLNEISDECKNNIIINKR